jgi:hypothetical protein
LDQGPGEKGKTEKQAPLSRRKMAFFSLPLWFLNTDAKKWNVDRRLGPINP